MSACVLPPPEPGSAADASGGGHSSDITPYLAAVLGLTVFAMYVSTLCPTVVGGDSGELITAAYTGGVAHPPGYPLYTVFVKLFTCIPFGSVAWRANLFSAVCNTAAAVVLMLAVRAWSRSAWAGLLAGGLFAFSPVVWRYSVVAEVFALNNLFIALLWFLASGYWRTRGRKTAYLGAFVFGLGMSHHHTLVFYGAPIVLWVLWHGRRDLLRPKPLVILSLLFLAGLLPYLYLPVASARTGLGSWGDATTLQGFLDHLLRREYGTFTGLRDYGRTTPALLCRSLFLYARALPGEVLYVGVPLALCGAVLAARDEGAAGLGGIMVAAFAFYLVVFHALLNLPIDKPLYYTAQTRFWQQANIVVFAFAGRCLGPAGWPRLRTLPGRVRGGFVAALALALVSSQAFVNRSREDQSENRLFAEFSSALLGAVPEGGLLVVRGDVYLPLIRYQQHCEGLRTDVDVLDVELLKAKWIRRVVAKHYPHVVLPPGRFERHRSKGRSKNTYGLEDLVDANLGTRTVFSTRMQDHSPTVWGPKYQGTPFGMLFSIEPKGTTHDPGYYFEESGEAFGGMSEASFPHEVRPGTWEGVVRTRYLNSTWERAKRLIEYGQTKACGGRALPEAKRLIEETIRVSPDPPSEWFKNLGIVCHRLLGEVPSAEDEMVDAFREYVRRSDGTDPQLATIKKMIHASVSRRRQGQGKQAE